MLQDECIRCPAHNLLFPYKGITFYQSSYGQATEGSEHYISATPRQGGVPEKIAVREGATVTLKDGTIFKLLEATQEVRQFAPGFTGPAARIEVTRKGGAPQTFIALVQRWLGLPGTPLAETAAAALPTTPRGPSWDAPG